LQGCILACQPRDSQLVHGPGLMHKSKDSQATVQEQKLLKKNAEHPTPSRLM
jgi:hypothetical protein